MLRIKLDHILFSLNIPTMRAATLPIVLKKQDRKFDAATLFTFVVVHLLYLYSTDSLAL